MELEQFVSSLLRVKHSCATIKNPEKNPRQVAILAEQTLSGRKGGRSETAAAKFPNLRVLKDNLSAVGQAIVVEKGNARKLSHLNRMVNDAIASGLVKAWLEGAKLAGVGVASAASLGGAIGPMRLPIIVQE